MTDVFDRYDKSVNYIVEVHSYRSQVKAFIEIVKTAGMEDNIPVQCRNIALIRELKQVFWGLVPPAADDGSGRSGKA
ncbi:hypothetical protein [uncultured Faecalibaculum sp.]|uniref:hypothetical protein n=1 Tax=uncultured Faecalibaculum sp. TaxID=1729681 RepID=UPI0025E43C6A|nr:hypothetical protein [uncultured Faecalibaculum sp.]